MLRQISVYAENRRGMMLDITEILQRENINIWGSVTIDNAEFGIIRMVVSDTQRALKAFQDAGYLCRVVDVIGVEVSDEVGNLNHLLRALDESNINVNYIYLSFSRDSARPIMVFHTEDAAEVEECLEMKGFTIA